MNEMIFSHDNVFYRILSNSIRIEDNSKYFMLCIKFQTWKRYFAVTLKLYLS